MALTGNPLRPRPRAFPRGILALQHVHHGDDCECGMVGCDTWRGNRRNLTGGHFRLLDAMIRDSRRVHPPKRRRGRRPPAYVVVETYQAELAAAAGLAEKTVQAYAAVWAQVTVEGEPVIIRNRRRAPAEVGAAGNRHPFRARINPRLVEFTRSLGGIELGAEERRRASPPPAPSPDSPEARRHAQILAMAATIDERQNARNARPIDVSAKLAAVFERVEQLRVERLAVSPETG